MSATAREYFFHHSEQAGNCCIRSWHHNCKAISIHHLRKFLLFSSPRKQPHAKYASTWIRMTACMNTDTPEKQHSRSTSSTRLSTRIVVWSYCSCLLHQDITVMPRVLNTSLNSETCFVRKPLQLFQIILNIIRHQVFPPVPCNRNSNKDTSVFALISEKECNGFCMLPPPPSPPSPTPPPPPPPPKKKKPKNKQTNIVNENKPKQTQRQQKIRKRKKQTTYLHTKKTKQLYE